MKPAVKVMRDGREVCQKMAAGMREYRQRIYEMWKRQDCRCCICHETIFLRDATFEHQDGRGISGGHRDDRIMKDGKPYNGAACFGCNSKKGSKRINYHEER